MHAQFTNNNINVDLTHPVLLIYCVLRDIRYVNALNGALVIRPYAKWNIVLLGDRFNKFNISYIIGVVVKNFTF